MRQLTAEETKQLFDKLAKYIGPNTKHLLERTGDVTADDDEAATGAAGEAAAVGKKRRRRGAAGGESAEATEEAENNRWVFRLHKGRIWYMPARLAKLASCVAKKNLMAIGVMFAKVTHNGHMRIQITALEHIAQYAVFKIWVKPTQEQQFLYGSHVTRAGLGRITEDTPQYQGVAVFNMADVPIGIGVAALGTLQCRRCEMNSNVLFHEADVGEYLRNEAVLT